MFNDKEYLEIETKLNVFTKKYNEQKEKGVYEATYLMKLKKDMEAELKADLQAYYDNQQTNLTEELEKIKEDWVNEQESLKPDASTQLLKRQELQMKMELASEKELKDMLEAYKKTAEGDKVELDFLRVEFRKRDLATEEIHLKAYMSEYNAGEEWRKHPEYLEKDQKLNNIFATRRTNMLHISDGDERRAVQLNVEAKEFKGFAKA